jgi:glycosyltransferase involved in cell wall biosynthesis
MASSPLENDLDLTLFVSCYNEEENIVGTLETLLEALGEFDFTWEIIVIDDASADRSVEVIQDFLGKHPDLPITLKTREINVGLAQNYIEGAFLGRGKYYRLICGDNVEPKETLVEVFKHLGEADMVLFYQDITGKSLARRIISRCYTLLVNLITGYRIKYYNGLPLHQRYHVMRWHTNYHGFGFQADMIARLLDEGFGYTEVRVKTTERKAGVSHALTLRNFFSVAHTLLDLLIRRVGRWRRTVHRRAAAQRRVAPHAAAESSQPQTR